MIFITLGKFRKKPSKEGIGATDKLSSEAQKRGVKLVGSYWTLGRYDSVFIWDGPDEGAVQSMMKSCLAIEDYVATETLVGLRREEALKLLD
jgi:uncharacterized protein with GYD domain